MWISKERYEQLEATEQAYLMDAKKMNYWIEYGRKMKSGVEHTINEVFCGNVLKGKKYTKIYNDLINGFKEAGAFQ